MQDCKRFSHIIVINYLPTETITRCGDHYVRDALAKQRAVVASMQNMNFEQKIKIEAKRKWDEIPLFLVLNRKI